MAICFGGPNFLDGKLNREADCNDFGLASNLLNAGSFYFGRKCSDGGVDDTDFTGRDDELLGRRGELLGDFIDELSCQFNDIQCKIDI